MALTHINTYLNRYLPLIEGELQDLIVSQGTVSTYFDMMRYHMGWLDEQLKPAQAPQGKRLRPVLCLLVCEAVGGHIGHALPAAAAIELLHNFSLIHDDIEDGSPTRRHRATVWKLWGMAQAINCGDGMFATAFLKLSQLQERSVPLDRIVDTHRILAETCLALTKGQYLDMTFETEMDVDLDSYLSMIGNKSARLIACSTQLGALLGGASPGTVTSYMQFGENLGMAFQVIDDILGIWGTEAVTGKSAATDILSRKKSLPIIYALQDPELRAIYTQDTIDERDASRIVTILSHKGAKAFAERVARQYSERAVHHLKQAGIDSPAHQAIGELVHLLLARDA